MALTTTYLIETARLTWKDPRAGARVVMGWPLSVAELWLVMALMATLSALLAEVLVNLSPDDIDPAMAAVMSNPLSFAALQFAGLAMLAGMVFALGRPFGGTGRFAQALAVVGWLQVFLLALQIVQIAAFLIWPFLALVIGLASLVITVRLLTSFTAELHGFRSLALTFIAIVFGFMLLIVGLSIGLIVFFGVGA